MLDGRRLLGLLLVLGMLVAVTAVHRRGAAGNHRSGHRGTSHGARHHRGGAGTAVHHNAFFDSMQGMPAAVVDTSRTADGEYTPSDADTTLSLPSLDNSAMNAEPLTPLSIRHVMPSARDFSSTTLPMPPPDPAAPAESSLPHSSPTPPREFAFAPRFAQISDSASASAATQHAIVSPDGGSLSPLRGERPSEPLLSHEPAQGADHDMAETAAVESYRQVIPIDVDADALEAMESGARDSPFDLMRFASVRGKELAAAGAGAGAGASTVIRNDEGEDISTPMAFTISGPIAPNGPEARGFAYRNRPRNIFAKRVVIPLGGQHNDNIAGPFDKPAHVDHTIPRFRAIHPTATEHNANLAAAPATPFGGDPDPLAFIQTEQRLRRSEHRRFGRGGGGGAAYGANAYEPLVFGDSAADTEERGDEFGGASFVDTDSHVWQRVDDRASDRRHVSPHFHHRYRSEQNTRAAYEAELMEDERDPMMSAQRDDMGHRLPRGMPSHSFLSAREDLNAEYNPQHLQLPAANAPRPHGQFASPPLDVDRFDPFTNSYGSKHARPRDMPSAPMRPAPPPVAAAPRRHSNPMGTLLPNTFIATHATAHKAKGNAKGNAKAKVNAKAKATPNAKAKAKAKAAPKPAPKPVVAKRTPAPSAPRPRAPSQPVAQKKATVATTVKATSAPIGMSLLQRIEHDAGVEAVATGSMSAAQQLPALQRLERAVRAAEERASLQAQIEQLQAQVEGLQRLASTRA